MIFAILEEFDENENVIKNSKCNTKFLFYKMISISFCFIIN